MKIAKKLKLIINIFSVVFIITLIAMIVNAIPFYYKAYNFNNNIGTWAKRPLNNMMFTHAFVIVKGILLITVVLYLRKVINAILIKKYFSIQVTRNLKKASIALIFTGVISLIIIIKLTLYSIYAFGLNYDSLFQVEFLWSFFLMIIGFFFMLVSYLFAEARDLKQENDLTI